MDSMMPPKQHPGDRLASAVAEAGWGRFAAEARGSAGHEQWPLQAPLPPILLASLVALLDALAVVAAGGALQAMPLPAGRPEPALIGFLAVLVPCLVGAVGGYCHSALYGSRKAAFAA